MRALHWDGSTLRVIERAEPVADANTAVVRAR
jgi:hypothetical protein